MSDLKNQLDVDIKRFLENIESQGQNARVESLRNLFKLHLHLNTCDLMLDKFDLQTIIGSAKTKFANEQIPIFLGTSKVKVDQNELPNLFVIEATISHLNKKDCLKKIPKFDKREDKF